MAEHLISNVSDTAKWVAVYRARETERQDALFKDPLAATLAGDLGQSIAKSVKNSMYTEWTVIIRTRVIDEMIYNLIPEGVDTVINVGAGLDTRPYRMDLPTPLKWIEIDFPHVIEHKQKILASESPRCALERIGMDLSNRSERQQLFAKIAGVSKKCLVLTEGVIVYLTNEQVSDLAQDLRVHPEFNYWIGEYLSPQVVNYLRKSRSMKHMKNAPFQFHPDGWFSFFADRGWRVRETRYLPEESIRFGRSVPAPWWMKILKRLMSPEALKKYHQFSGFTLFERAP